MTLRLILFYLIIYRLAFAAETNGHCFPSRPKESRGELELWDYGPNMFCSALLTAPNSYGIYMYFLECDLEHWRGVDYDYIVLFNGTDCLAPGFAVTSEKRIFTSPGTNISLLFISDLTEQGSGFRLLYQPETEVDAWKLLQAKPSPFDRILHNCGMELNTTTTRTISWKGQDEKNTLCIWRIKGDEGDIVSLKIEKLQLEMETDFLRVLDGTDCGAEVIYLFRGNWTFQPQSIYSTSNAMVIVLAVPIAKYDHIYSSYSFLKGIGSDASSNKAGITVQSSESATRLEDEPTSVKGIGSDASSNKASSTTEHPVDGQRGTLVWSKIQDPDRALNIAGICGQEVIVHIPRELSWKRKHRADSLCTWSIRSKPGQQLALSMVDFNLGTESYLQILEGHNQNMKLIAQYSRSMYEWLPTIYAQSGRMVMVINLPAKSAGGYFRAHLSPVNVNMSTEQGYTGNRGRLIPASLPMLVLSGWMLSR